MPAELFALANAFFFALHNLLTKKALRYSNPAVEKVTARSLVSAAMIVAGVMMITWWQ